MSAIRILKRKIEASANLLFRWKWEKRKSRSGKNLVQAGQGTWVHTATTPVFRVCAGDVKVRAPNQATHVGAAPRNIMDHDKGYEPCNVMCESHAL